MAGFGCPPREEGVPGKVVAQLMGHTNADVTVNVYTQILDASLRTTVDRIGDELFTIVHGTETGSELNR
jgi:integrase